MKKSFVSSLCLLLLGVSICSPSFAQSVSSKKPLQQVPVGSVAGPAANSSIEISEGSAFADGINGVAVSWTTSFETGNYGFNVYRVDADGNKTQVNSSLIGGSFLRRSPKFPENSGAAYSSYDRAGSAAAKYFVESIDLGSGKSILYGPISPVRIKNLSARLGYDPQLRPDLADQQNGLILKNYPASLPEKDSSAGAVSGAESALADPVKQQWVAAQPGVKFQVRKSGIYHVSRAQLQAAGFNVAAAPVLWQLYVDGEEQKMIVDPAGNFVEFYGSGVDNQNSDSRYYYLVVGPQAGQRISTIFRSPFAPNIQGKNFRSVTSFEERINYVNQIVNGDQDNWWGAILSPSVSVSRNVNIKDIDSNRQKAFVEISLHGFLNGPHHVQVTLNGAVIGFIDFDGLVPTSKIFNVNASHINEGANTFEFIGLGGSSDYTLLKSIKIDYTRFYRADQNTLVFDTQHQHSTRVAGFNTPNVRVFDMAFPGSPQLISNTTTAAGANGFDVSIPSGRGHPMIAVNENSLLSPVAITPNTASQMSSGTSNAHMLIISHANFMSGANNWATYRRANGLNVDVINVEDIYDEFDYGLPTPKALRGFLQYANANYPNLKYVMMVGDATYDPRNYLGAGYNDYIPTKFVNTAEGESPSDETLGDLNNDAVAEMAIGRLPVRTNASVTLLLGKLAAFEPTVPVALQNRGVLFVADEPRGYLFSEVNRSLRDELPKGTPVLFIDLQIDTIINDIRAQIIDGINGGRFIVNYTGHGAPGVWSSKQIFRMSDVPLLTNANDKLSMFFMLTCLNGYFVDPSNDWLAEALLKHPTGGAAVVWASTGSTTPDIQEIMATKFFHLLGQGTHARLGDAIKESKLNAPNPEIPLTWALFGDPALHIK